MDLAYPYIALSRRAGVSSAAWSSRIIAAVMAVPVLAEAQSDLQIIGLPQLLAVEPSLTGAGVRVGQVEANFGTSSYLFEVNPDAVGQPADLFTYTNEYGNVSTTFNSAAESSHADAVGAFFYGTTGSGVSPGVEHVDNYSSDYFFNSIIFWDESIPDQIVNQSFNFVQSTNMATNILNQESSDTEYDNYVAEFGTIIVTAVGDGGSTPYPVAPSTSYNEIAVATDDGSSGVGPTIDNGRAKPDITAPGGATSYSSALVSGCAAILVQAADSGYGGSAPQVEAAAADPRTIKALLLNGADKTAVTFKRTPTSPLDPANGAGVVNVYDSFEQLAAGEYSPSSISSASILSGTHSPDVTSPAINSPAGWDLGTLTSSVLVNSYANYIFEPPSGVTNYTFTATLDWERHFNSNQSVPLGINNLDLYLYNTTTDTLVDSSNSTVNNVQCVYDQGLQPGDRYDLEVLKTGGIPGVTLGVVSNSETYALAFNFTAMQSVWNLSGGGSGSVAGNWTGGIPDAATDTASFAGAIKTSSTVTFPTDWVVGNINFDNTSYSYTIASSTGGPLILDNGGASATATIDDSAGNHAISAPIQLNSNLDVSVASAGNELSISGNISDNAAYAGAALTVGGNGTLDLTGVNTYRCGTTINSGALVIGAAGALPSGSNVVNNSLLSIAAGNSSAPVVAGKISGAGGLAIGGGSAGFLQLAAGSGASSQSSLSISSGSTLDIANNSFVINYSTPAADPVSAVLASLTSGYNKGNWNGAGIISSTAAAGGLTPLLSVGYNDGNTDPGCAAAPNQIVIKYTLAGDANLDGQVNFTDLLVVARDFNTTGNDWAHGNFIYSASGLVNFADLVIVAQNFNKSLPVGDSQEMSLQATVTPIPEPATGALFASTAGWLLCRCRRKQPCFSVVSPVEISG
jgi:autotransporter-associated beta strand protein